MKSCHERSTILEHDNVARINYWRLCGKYNLKRYEKWYGYAPEGVIKNEEVKILWDVVIQSGREIKTRKPDIVVVNRNERSCAIIDIAIPGDIAKRRNREGKN